MNRTPGTVASQPMGHFCGIIQIKRRNNRPWPKRNNGGEKRCLELAGQSSESRGGGGGRGGSLVLRVVLVFHG